MIPFIISSIASFAGLLLFFAWQCARADRDAADAECRRARNLAEAWRIEAEHRWDQFCKEAAAHRLTKQQAERRLREYTTGAWGGRN